MGLALDWDTTNDLHKHTIYHGILRFAVRQLAPAVWRALYRADTTVGGFVVSGV